MYLCLSFSVFFFLCLCIPSGEVVHVLGNWRQKQLCLSMYLSVSLSLFFVFVFYIPSGEVVHGPGNWRQPFFLGRQRQSRAIGNFCILPINFVPMSTNQPQTNRGPPSPIINQVLQNTNQMQILISATKYATKRKIAGTSKRNI